MKQRILGWIARRQLHEGQALRRGAAQDALASSRSRAAAAIENARLYEDLQRHVPADDRGPREGHRQDGPLHRGPLRSRRDLRDVPRHAARPLARADRDRPAERADARHRQDRLRAQPEQARQAHARRVRDVQEAPGYGRDILEPIKFLHPLIPGVHLHHERWDGRGYPLGLKGQRTSRSWRASSPSPTPTTR